MSLLNIPAYSGATVNLTAFNIHAAASVGPAAFFFTPVLPGTETVHIPAYSFLVNHPPSSQNGSEMNVMFDLGTRKDIENLPPAVVAFLDLGFQFIVEKDVTERLEEAGVSVNKIDTVIWSHDHTDHIGDVSKFPSNTSLVIGQGTVRDIFNPDTNPNGSLLESDFADREVIELDFNKSSLKIGSLPALDFFSDGSLYLLDDPGHAKGHIAALARVKPTEFVLLSGDTFHSTAQIRPTSELQQNIPCPHDLLESARQSISTEFFTSGGNDTSGFDLQSRTGPFLGLPEKGFYADPARSRISQEVLHAFDADEDVFVVAAHDETLASIVENEPGFLNSWKDSGVKDKVVWAFANGSEPSFRLGPKSN